MTTANKSTSTRKACKSFRWAMRIWHLLPTPLLAKKMWNSLWKHPDRKANASFAVNAAKIDLVRWCGSLYSSWHGLAQGINSLFRKDPYAGTTDETFHQALLAIGCYCQWQGWRTLLANQVTAREATALCSAFHCSSAGGDRTQRASPCTKTELPTGK